MNTFKARFARPDDGARTRADALRGADVILGLSKAGQCSPDMLKTMAPRPLIFTLANPDAEISYRRVQSDIDRPSFSGRFRWPTVSSSGRQERPPARTFSFPAVNTETRSEPTS